MISAVANSTSVVRRLLNEYGKLGVAFSRNLLKQTKVAYNHFLFDAIKITFLLLNIHTVVMVLDLTQKVVFLIQKVDLQKI